MKRISVLLNLLVLVLSILVADGASAASVGYFFDVRDYGASGNDGIDDAQAVQEAMDAAVAGGIMYFPPGTFLLESDLTIGPNVGLFLSQGALLRVAAGVTVAISSPDHLVAQKRQHVFELVGTGRVVFMAGGNVSPCWWGAVGDRVTDDTAAIQAAIDALVVGSAAQGWVQIPTGIWRFSNLMLHAGSRLRGDADMFSILERTDDAAGTAITWDGGSAAKICFEHLRINGNDRPGDVVNIGDQRNQWGSQGYVNYLYIWRAGGRGFVAYGNALFIDHLQVSYARDTCITINGGSNICDFIGAMSDADDVNGVDLSAEGSYYDEVYTEGKFATPVILSASYQTVNHVTGSYSPDAAITNMIHLTSRAGACSIKDIYLRSVAASAVINMVQDDGLGITLPRTSNRGSYTNTYPAYDTYVVTGDLDIGGNGGRFGFKKLIATGLASDIAVMLQKSAKAFYSELTIINADSTYNVILNKCAGDPPGSLVGGDSLILLPGESITLVNDGSSWVVPNSRQYLRRAVDLINAEIKACRGSPVELVSAPGAGMMLELVSATLVLDYGSSALTESNDDLAIVYDNGYGPAASDPIPADRFITATADTIAMVHGIDLIGVPTSSCVNTNLVLVNVGDDEYGGNAEGDTEMRVIVTYRIHNALGL